jgi:uncharacterized protein (TIGR02246 family)
MQEEQAIRQLVADWQEATAAGDLNRLLSLMAEDVVFLAAGQPPMRGRDAFAKAFHGAMERFAIASECRVEELRVAGDWAYCWNHLRVTMTPRGAGAVMRRSGDTLTVLRKEDGGWVITRDANLLSGE